MPSMSCVETFLGAPIDNEAERAVVNYARHIS
jgi:hypothetical protein